ncbi:C40 family peptidase [Herbiconiux sp. 11R-BC]|uniref:C40 family peptidase n=1 Tax=Herbiconiux sp. 11R-BC TaxID=3111637 RepID=UPI003BFDD245
MRVTATTGSAGLKSAPRRAAAALAIASAAVLAATMLIVSPAAATDYPSWNQVEAARASESAKQAQITEIQNLIAGIQSQVAAAQSAADKAWADDQAAQNALAEGTRKADQLQAQATAAAAQSEASNKRAAALAAQFARSAGNDLSSRLLVAGSDSSDLLYQLGTMSKLSETSEGVFDKAKQDANTASSLSDQAGVAKQGLTVLAQAADAALAQALDAQKSVQSALLEQENHQAELSVQLTALQQDTITTEQQYNDGVAAAKAAELAAQQAAADALAAQQAAEEQAAASGGGSSDSGGGGSAPAPSAPSAPSYDPPAQSYSGEAVVAYAEQFVGVVPYGWGADPSDSFGCDGLTQYVFGQFGISLPRLVSRQAAMGVRVSPQDAQAGDLVVWPGTHIGIYDGHGGVIHSPDWGRYVTHATGLWGSFYFVRLV